MGGLLSYGVYVPFRRLPKAAIGAALGSGPARGNRAVASYDEDSTTMGVEAARLALRGYAPPAQLLFATASPAYLDKANAAVVHAALGLMPETFAADMVGSVRSGVAAIRAALQASAPTLVVLADTRSGRPGSADERDGGDGAVALLFGDGPVLLEPLAFGSATAEFLDRWRRPGDSHSQVWEERFGENVYQPLAQQAVTAALKDAALSETDITHLLVTGLHHRACRSVARAVGIPAEATDLLGSLGDTGTAQMGIALADCLDRAKPGDVICSLVLSDGASCLLWRVTDQTEARPAPDQVRDLIARHGPDLDYPTFLTWTGRLDREPPRRPDPAAPAAPPSMRRHGWKFGFVATKCTQCGTRHLPPSRVCLTCDAVDRMVEEPMADAVGRITTFTVDRLAYTPSPPMVAAVVDFDGGGRLRCELTDVDPAGVHVGQRVEMTFRRLGTVNGVHNYFWKARPVVETGEGS